jgi:dihydrolipoamide dehydrogenase
MAVGSVPNTQDIGLEEVGVAVRESGHVVTDKVSRTSVRGIYAAGDCTGVFPLASVAGMQGRIAMSHALGDTVNPIKLRTVAANIFTATEIANVGYTQKELLELDMKYTVTRIELKGNARAKMMGIREGFVKLFSRTESGTVVGGVIVAPRASELIYPITLAVQHRLTVDEVAGAFTVYPSLTGTIAEAALQGHRSID